MERKKPADERAASFLPSKGEVWVKPEVGGETKMCYTIFVSTNIFRRFRKFRDRNSGRNAHFLRESGPFIFCALPFAGACSMPRLHLIIVKKEKDPIEKEHKSAL
ncbi:hypothetical protein [Paenibacillus sp. SAF-054]|uniref:hypothetical protein n=1 Tax=Paenibacillus sp. SAF-054 TaxID=3436863 RepID=UPI003F7D1395